MALAPQPPGPCHGGQPSRVLGAPAPARPALASVAPEAVRIHTHAQLQQEEGWPERKEHWTTTRD